MLTVKKKQKCLSRMLLFGSLLLILTMQSGEFVYAYSRKQAVQYANDYAKNPNQNYNYYEGADCTNFVSQCLLAGGKATNSSWCPYNNAWINAQSFADYWKSRVSRRPVQEINASNCVEASRKITAHTGIGDVIQYYNSSQERISHSQFVTGLKAYNDGHYSCIVAQHSDNKSDIILEDYLKYTALGRFSQVIGYHYK